MKYPVQAINQIGERQADSRKAIHEPTRNSSNHNPNFVSASCDFVDRLTLYGPVVFTKFALWAGRGRPSAPPGSARIRFVQLRATAKSMDSARARSRRSCRAARPRPPGDHPRPSTRCRRQYRDRSQNVEPREPFANVANWRWKNAPAETATAGRRRRHGQSRAASLDPWRQGRSGSVGWGTADRLLESSRAGTVRRTSHARRANSRRKASTVSTTRSAVGPLGCPPS